MGILLCEQNFRDVWIRNKSVWAEIGQILRAHTHTTAAKLVPQVTSLTCPDYDRYILLFPHYSCHFTQSPTLIVFGGTHVTEGKGNA